MSEFATRIVKARRAAGGSDANRLVIDARIELIALPSGKPFRGGVTPGTSSCRFVM